MTDARRYDIGGHVLEVEMRRPELTGRLDGMIGPLRLEGGGDAEFRIDVDVGAPLPAPDEASLVYAGPLLEEGDCIYSQLGDTLYLEFPGIVRLEVDTARRASIVVDGKHLNRVGHSAGMLALSAACDATGQSVLHAAGLVLPDRDEVILLHAPSGTGKTTTSLALAQRGFGLCSDDVMVLNVDGGAVRAWGFPRGVKVHRRTAAMLPGLGDLVGPTWDRNDEQFLELQEIAGSVRIESAKPRPVAAVFHLVRASDGASSVRPTSQTDALASLALDNVRVGRTGLLGEQQRRFQVLARLVGQAPAFEVRVASSPIEIAGLIEGCL